nr:unnamed protein product [Callosobruchus chinensis]
MRNTRNTRGIHQSVLLYTMDRKCSLAIFRLSNDPNYIFKSYLFFQRFRKYNVVLYYVIWFIEYDCMIVRSRK